MKQDSGRDHYQQKCEACGHVASTVIQIGEPHGSNRISTSFICSKCRNNQRVEIKGS